MGAFTRDLWVSIYCGSRINKCTPEGWGDSSRFPQTGGLPPTNLKPLFAAFAPFSSAIASICLNMRFLYRKHLTKTPKETIACAPKPSFLMLAGQSQILPYNSTLHLIKSSTPYAIASRLKSNVLDDVLSLVL